MVRKPPARLRRYAPRRSTDGLPLKDALDTLVSKTFAPDPRCPDEPTVRPVMLDMLDPLDSYGSDTTVLVSVLRADYELFGIDLAYRSFVPVDGAPMVREEVEGIEFGSLGLIVAAFGTISGSPTKGVNAPGTAPIRYDGPRSLMNYLLGEFEPFVLKLSESHDDLLDLKAEYAR